MSYNDIPNEIFINKGSRQFTKKLDFGSGTFETRSVAIADMNNDGILDIVTGNYLKPNSVFMNLDGKTFEKIDLSDKPSRTYGVTVEETYSRILLCNPKSGLIRSHLLIKNS